MPSNTSHLRPSLSAARFYAILDTGYVAPARWADTCRALLDGGADLIQLRAKRETAAERRSLLEKILPLFEQSSTPLIINDDLELACAYPRLGLHVGQDDIDIAKARDALGEDRLLGLSTHSVEQARRAIAQRGLLDYFAVGPVFATPTKPEAKAVGLELVRTVAGMAPPLPWFCIGGIKSGNLDEVRSANGERVVVVSEVLQAADPTALVHSYQARLA